MCRAYFNMHAARCKPPVQQSERPSGFVDGTLPGRVSTGCLYPERLGGHMGT